MERQKQSQITWRIASNIDGEFKRVKYSVDEWRSLTSVICLRDLHRGGVARKKTGLARAVGRMRGADASRSGAPRGYSIKRRLRSLYAWSLYSWCLHLADPG